MELRQLRYFVAVAEHGHFGRAADHLHMAQPALSRAIRQFEEAIGAVLFVRSTRHVALSAAGDQLLHDARDLLSRADRAQQRAHDIHNGHAGSLRIGFTGSASYDYLPKLVRTVSAELPDLNLEVETEMLTPDQERALLDGRIEIGVLRLPLTADQLDWRVAAKESLIAAVPAGHHLAGQRRISVADLADEPFITYRASSGSVVGAAVLQVCQKAGFTPHRLREVTETATLLSLVAAGLGVALVPSGARSMTLDDVVFCDLDESRDVDLAIAWHKNQSPASISVLLDALERGGFLEAEPTPQEV